MLTLGLTAEIAASSEAPSITLCTIAVLSASLSIGFSACLKLQPELFLASFFQAMDKICLYAAIATYEELFQVDSEKAIVDS